MLYMLAKLTLEERRTREDLIEAVKIIGGFEDTDGALREMKII